MDFNYSPFEISTTTGALFLCLVFVCVFSEAKHIEQTLGAQAASAVAEQDLYWSSVEPSGQHMVLAGAAPDHAAKMAAERAAAAIWGVTAVDNQIEILGQGGACQSQLDEYLNNEKVTFKSGRGGSVRCELSGTGNARKHRTQLRSAAGNCRPYRCQGRCRDQSQAQPAARGCRGKSPGRQRRGCRTTRSQGLR